MTNKPTRSFLRRQESIESLNLGLGNTGMISALLDLLFIQFSPQKNTTLPRTTKDRRVKEQSLICPGETKTEVVVPEARVDVDPVRTPQVAHADAPPAAADNTERTRSRSYRIINRTTAI